MRLIASSAASASTQVRGRRWRKRWTDWSAPMIKYKDDFLPNIVPRLGVAERIDHLARQWF
jgi:hypothetical protein